MPELLDKFAAGELLRKKREQLGYTQEQVVAVTSVPVAAYLSELENGKVSLARSKHFASLAKFLRFTYEEIRSVNPAAVFDYPGVRSGPIQTELEKENADLFAEKPDSRSSAALSAGALGYKIPKQRPIIPDELKDAADKYGDLPMFEGIREYRWQHFMVTVPRKKTPQDAEGWLQEFTALKNMGYDPQEPEE
ncbi:helix-turn-helix domain-containing protein [Deinococcus navajonensis]|uniref:Helix-turn-helix domain-containing protein n=1 Tax=Deinococcus navajonensis TaxID=309884 RepID=A0ABV8XNP5_9DEIO